MSQYPSPYSLPPYPPHSDNPYAPTVAGAAAKRAATLLVVLGGLILLLGACNTISTILIPAQELLSRQKSMMPSGGDMPFSAETMKTITVVCGLITVLVGGAFVSLAGSVRRGSSGGTLGALILSAVLTIIVGLILLTVILSGLAQPTLLPLACLPGIPFALLALQTVWLSRAFRAKPQMTPDQMRYAAQYWQYQQNTPAQGGYGYITPPPNSAPPAAPQQPYPWPEAPASPPTTENPGEPPAKT